ncbi:MAG: RDD family protein [Rubripirellula sp.]
MKIKCPACQAVLNIPDTAAGKVVKCPCGKQLRAPGGSPAATAQAAQPAPAPAGAARPAAAPPARPAARRAPAPQAGGFDAGLFDELTDQDLQPVASQYSTPQTQAPTPAGGGLLNQYAPPSELGYAGGGTEIAGIGARLAGYMIDVMFIGAGLALGVGIFAALSSANSDVAAMIGFAVLILCFMVPVIVNAVLITKSGQTVGKKVVGTRIVMERTYQTPGFLHGWLLRSFIGFFVLSEIVPFYGLVNVLMVFSENARMVHDRIAGTIVVKA